jgi:ATP-dependent Clp protease adaptor protein ClpS
MAEDQAVLDEVVSVRDVENDDHIGYQGRIKNKQDQQRDQRPKRQPRYNVILWDDPDHSYEYVITLVKELFRKPIEMGYQVAKEVDTTGRAILLTTTREHAELKRDQIHAFGKDQYIERCKGSMSATIEPAE